MEKNRKKIATLMLALSLLMTSCTRDDEVVFSVEAEDIPDFDKPTELNEIEFEQITQSILVEKTIDELQNISVDYRYFDAYPTEDEIDAYIANVSLETVCLMEQELNDEEMYRQIYKNTQEKLQQSSEYSNPFENEEFCQALKKALSQIMHEENNIIEDGHRLSESSILFINHFTEEGDIKTVEANIRPITLFRNEKEFIIGEYREEDNMIILYKDGIDTYYNYFVYDGSYESYYTIFLSTLLHEMNHLRESICDCRIEQGAITTRGIDYDGEYVPSLSESSCESSLYIMDLDPYKNQKVYDDYSYSYERKSEMYLMFLALFNENAKSEDYYHAMFDTDLNELYNFFHLETREDIYDFYRIMYTMDTLNFRTTLAEQFNAENIRDQIGETYRVAIIKRTLIDMIKYTEKHPEFTLEENILLYQIIKNYLTDEANGYSIATSPSGFEYYAKTYDADFLKSIEEIDTIYLTFLRDYYHVSSEEIEALKTDNLEREYYYLSYGINDLGEHTGLSNTYSLLERFPILKNIMTKYELPYSAYDTYMAKGKFYVDLKS